MKRETNLIVESLYGKYGVSAPTKNLYKKRLHESSTGKKKRIVETLNIAYSSFGEDADAHEYIVAKPEIREPQDFEGFKEFIEDAVFEITRRLNEVTESFNSSHDVQVKISPSFENVNLDGAYFDDEDSDNYIAVEFYIITQFLNANIPDCSVPAEWYATIEIGHDYHPRTFDYPGHNVVWIDNVLDDTTFTEEDVSKLVQALEQYIAKYSPRRMTEKLSDEEKRARREWREFIKVHKSFDDSEWNSWDQQQRDAFCDKVAAEFLKKFPQPTQTFLDWLEDENFHSQSRAFDRLLGQR